MPLIGLLVPVPVGDNSRSNEMHARTLYGSKGIAIDMCNRSGGWGGGGGGEGMGWNRDVSDIGKSELRMGQTMMECG